MFAKLKNQTIRKKIEKLLFDKSKRSIVDSQQVKSIAIVAQHAQKELVLHELKTLALTCELSGDKIHVLFFRQFDKKTEYESNEFTEKDFGWFGRLKLNKLQEFVKNDCDLFINYGLQENLYLNMVTLASQSKFKVGFANPNFDLYDLAISEENNDVSLLTSEMVKYLKILKKL